MRALKALGWLALCVPLFIAMAAVAGIAAALELAGDIEDVNRRF